MFLLLDWLELKLELKWKNSCTPKLLCKTPRKVLSSTSIPLCLAKAAWNNRSIFSTGSSFESINCIYKNCSSQQCLVKLKFEMINRQVRLYTWKYSYLNIIPIMQYNVCQCFRSTLDQVRHYLKCSHWSGQVNYWIFGQYSVEKMLTQIHVPVLISYPKWTYIQLRNFSCKKAQKPHSKID